MAIKTTLNSSRSGEITFEDDHEESPVRILSTLSYKLCITYPFRSVIAERISLIVSLVHCLLKSMSYFSCHEHERRKTIGVLDGNLTQ